MLPLEMQTASGESVEGEGGGSTNVGKRNEDGNDGEKTAENVSGKWRII